MASVAIVVDGGLLELGRVGAAMGIVAIRTDDLSFPHRHVRGTHELRFALQVALAAHFDFCAIDAEGSYIGKLCQLFAARLLHDRVAINARYTPIGMWTCFPIGLYAALMTAETCFVLNFRGLA